MAVDFQSHQHQAKQSTARLVLLFGFGVVAVIAIVTALVVTLFYYGAGVFEPFASVVVAVPATGLLIGGASLVKSAQIRSGGGSYVAASLGGRPVDFNTLDPTEKQLCNVVEEMAIASGLPVPALFVLDEEPGINAFAAGWSPDTAAIGVTRGALTHFTRRELQGVIGHEMAHIANGDTRVKTRIIAWVFGIAVLSVIGRLILNHIWFLPRRSSRGNDNNNGFLIVAAAGLGLVVIGAVGTFFGQMLQAAVSRQREYLADASAVQFTRDPSSIGDALVKIAAVGSQNFVRSAHGTETQHLFFASALRSSFATHPPIEDRIQRLLPHWDGTLPQIEIVATPVDDVRGWVRAEAKRQDAARKFRPRSTLRSEAWSQATGPSLHGTVQPEGQPASAAAASVWSRGTSSNLAPQFDGPSPAHVDYARHLLSQIPTETQDFLHTRQGAVAAVIGLLAAPNGDARTHDLEMAGAVLGFEPGYLNAASASVSGLHRSLHLPAVDLALHSIAEFPFEYRQRLLATLTAISGRHDDKDLFRWMLGRAVVRHIADQDDDASAHNRHQLHDLGQQATLLYAVIAHFNSSGRDGREPAFRTALAETGLGSLGGMDGVQLPPIEALTFDRLDAALDQLAQLSVQGRQDLIRGAAKVVHHDGKTSVEEAELIRVVADAVRLPMPPLLPG